MDDRQACGSGDSNTSLAVAGLNTIECRRKGGEAALSLLLAPAGNLNEGWPAEGGVGAGDVNDPQHTSMWSPSHFLIEGGVRKQPMLFFGQGDGETQMMRDAPMV